MKSNHLLKTGIALVAMCASPFASAKDGWTENFAAAKKEATEGKKDLLLDFTGSDWCGWCIKLDKEVFSQDPFKSGVKDKFVLVELDYPNDKSKLSEETIKQNSELKVKYAIEGYPTILLCDEEGRPFASTGYQEGGPEAYVKHLDELRGKRKTRDEALAAASKKEGVEKAKVLVSALSAMDLSAELVSNFYGKEIALIKASDPKDVTGYAKAEAVLERQAKFESELNDLARKSDFEGALTLVDKTLKEGGFDKEQTTNLLMTKAMINARLNKFDAAIAAANEAKATAPEGAADEIDKVVKQFEAAKEKSKDAPVEDKKG